MIWPEATLTSIATPKGLVGGPFGSSLVNQDYEPAGIPVIRGANLNAGGMFGGDFAFVSEEKFQRDLMRNSASPGDLVFTQRGTLGQVAVVPDGPFDRYVVSQSQMRLRIDSSIAVARYVYYACRSHSFLRQIDDNAIATGVPHINLGILGRLNIPLPSLTEQHAIAEVLGALDDKIIANTKLLATIDALAQAQFRAALRDAHLQPLSDCAEFVNGKAFTKGASGTGRVVVRIAELNSGIGGSTVFSDAVVENKHVASPGDILFAWSGSLTLHRWFRNDAIVNQHIFKVIQRDGYPDWLVYELLRNKIEDFKLIAADKATTMGHIQRKHLDEPVLVPSNPLRQEISPIMEALWRAAFTVERENLTLVTMRDTLLPQLMSGSLRVRDSETMVASVVRPALGV